jgi:endonuclease/exonuclease/phosphatase family metal-dependent hydrolase
VRAHFKRPVRWALTACLVVPALSVGALPAPAVAQEATPSRAVAASVKLDPPAGLRAQPSAGSADAVALNWSFWTAGQHYQVQYGTDPGFGGAALKSVTVASTAIGGLITGVAYFFRVRSVNAAGAATSGWSTPVTATPQVPADPDAKPLQVSTYNIRNWKRTAGGKWSVRGPLVAKTILSRHQDVVGLQEADFNTVGGISQIQSLLRMLNAKGADYRLVITDTSAGTRIIYNAATLSVERAGARRLTSVAGDVKRYVVWAVFTQQSTGRRFYFATTHLVNDPKPVATKKCSGAQSKYYKMRLKQAGQVMDEIRVSNTAGLPVILTGDMNSHKVHCPTNAPYRVYVGAGLVDPLGNPDRSRVPVNPTTEVRIHSEWDSSNHYARTPVRHNTINAHHVDYVFVSGQVRTLEYEIVVNINDSTLKYVGRHASDHNMVRATVLIPAS